LTAPTKYKEEDIMPVVIVEMWEGRTMEEKKQIAEGITSSFVKIGIPQEVVQIIMKDNPKHNWAIGGKLASD
jgi:4-oxalocrotonate tautomerase